MATFSSGAGSYTLILNVNEVDGSADVGSNTSQVSWSLQMRADSAYCQWNPGPGDFEVRINGGLVWSAQNPSLWYGGMGGTLTLASGTTTVGHNSDGSKTVYCEGKYIANSTANYLPNSSTCGGNLTLFTIPRASSFSSISGNTIGGSQTINIDRKSSSFTHSLWYKTENGDWVGIGSGIGTSITWTLPTSLNNQIPNSTSLTLTYILRTYNGSTQIGSDVYYNYTVYYSGNNPNAGSVAITYANLFNGKFIANHSTATIKHTGYGGVYGSSIKSAQVIFNGGWKGTTNYNTGKLTAGTHTFQGVVTDSRDKTVYTSQQSFTCYQINNPTVSINAYRSDAEGNASPSGTYITIIPTYSAHDPVGGNSIKSNSFTCTSLMTTGTAIESGSKKILSNAAVDSEYVISGTVTDQLGRSSATSIKVGTAFVLWDVRPDEKGMAFGKYSTGADKFEVAWDAYFDNDLEVDGKVHANSLSAGSSSIIGYPIYGAAGAAAWYKIGTWTSGGDAHDCKITILTGDGYNGGHGQNTEIEVFIKDGWQSSPALANAFGGSYIVKYNYNNGIRFKLLATTHNTVDIWAYFPWSYWNGHYIFEGFGTFIHGNDTNQSSEPSYGTYNEIINYTADYKGYPVGSIYLSWNNTNPQTFMGGTWVRMAEGRTLIGEGWSNDGNISKYFGPNETGGNHVSQDLNCGESIYGFTHYSQVSYYADRTIVRSKAINGSHGEINANVSLIQPYITVYVWRRTA